MHYNRELNVRHKNVKLLEKDTKLLEYEGTEVFLRLETKSLIH